MPSRSKTPCKYPRCSALVEAGQRYCDNHKQIDYRGSSSKQGYGAIWRKVRQMALNEEPLCRRCKAKNLTVAAEMVHHIDNDNTNNTRENLEPLCDNCHRAEHGFANSRGHEA